MIEMYLWILLCLQTFENMLSDVNINVPTIPYLPKPSSFISDAETRILFKSMLIQSV